MRHDRAKVVDTGFVQGAGGQPEYSLVDLLGTALAADLQGRVRRVEVWGGVEKPQQNDAEHQQVLPEGVLVKHVSPDEEAAPL